MIKVLYYYYYLFYKKIWHENDPHFTTILSLSFLFSLYLNCFIDLILALTLSVTLNIYYYMSILLIIAIVMYLSFLKNKKGEYIVLKEKPVFLNNSISIIISITSFLFGILIMFFEADIIRAILNKY
jgi:hypothetical protein